MWSRVHRRLALGVVLPRWWWPWTWLFWSQMSATVHLLESRKTFVILILNLATENPADRKSVARRSSTPLLQIFNLSNFITADKKNAAAQSSIFLATSVSINTLPLCFHAGIHYRKSCASSGACLIASSGYQQFCTGRLNSVCIYCCNTPLCNGPRRRRPISSAAATSSGQLTTQMPLLLAFYVMPRLLM